MTLQVRATLLSALQFLRQCVLHWEASEKKWSPRVHNLQLSEEPVAFLKGAWIQSTLLTSIKQLQETRLLPVKRCQFHSTLYTVPS